MFKKNCIEVFKEVNKNIIRIADVCEEKSQCEKSDDV